MEEKYYLLIALLIAFGAFLLRYLGVYMSGDRSSRKKYLTAFGIIGTGLSAYFLYLTYL